MAASKKNKQLTPEQVLSFLSSGGSFTDLSSKVSDKDLLRVLVGNPELLTGFRQQSQSLADQSGLDTYDTDRTYYDPQQLAIEVVNPTEEKWRQISTAYPNQWKFVNDFFDKVRASGNNPATADALIEEQKLRAKDYGLDETTASTLVESLKGDRDSFLKDELDKLRREEAENYKAWTKQRQDLGIKAGESASQTIFGKSTGFGDLYSLPDPKETFAALAKRRAGEEIKTPTPKPLRGTLGKGSKGYKNTEKQQEQLAKINKKVIADRSQFERGYMQELEKRGKIKSTPYQEALKKVIPSVLLKKALG